MQANGRSCKWFNALATLVTQWRNRGRAVILVWRRRWGPESAIEHARQLIPRCVVGWWGVAFAAQDALVREVKEETGYTVKATELIGVYFRHWHDSTSIRFSFVCELVDEPLVPIEDKTIMEAIWMPIEEVKERREEYRRGSTEVTFDDYFAGKRYPMDTVKCFEKIRD